MSVADAPAKCAATLACGRPCAFRARDSHDGQPLCGVHLRQKRAEVECSVCLCGIKRRACATMACGHAFHSKCLRSWFRGRPLTCPLCRATCVEGLALVGGSRLAPKLQALTRTLPPPPRAFFPAYIVSHLECARVRDALGLDKARTELLVDLACECFTREFFFAKVRAMGL